MYKYTEPAELYGISGINNYCPSTRPSASTTTILWIAATWVSFALFVLPYLGVRLSKARVLAILGAVTALGVLLGLWASYLRPPPDPIWFIVRSRRSPVTSQGAPRLWLTAALLSYLSLTVWEVSKTSPEPTAPYQDPGHRPGRHSLRGLQGALTVVTPWRHFTIDEHFR